MRPSYSICITTFRRPAYLDALLTSIASQDWLPGPGEWEILVVDNDDVASAATVVERQSTASKLPIRYERTAVHANISVARNTALALASKSYVLFIDDDQLLPKSFLRDMHAMWSRQPEEISGLMMIKRPVFAENAPAWVRSLDVFGTAGWRSEGEIPAAHVNTSGVLMRRSVFEGLAQPFDPMLGITGGEDNQFFRSAGKRGARFRIGIEILEMVPESRASIAYLLSRAFNEGLIHAYLSTRDAPLSVQLRYALKSFVAFLAATAAFPLVFCANKSTEMKIRRYMNRQLGKLSHMCFGTLRRSYRSQDATIRSIFFHLRPTHRMRHRATVASCPRTLLAFSPKIASFPEEHTFMLPPATRRERVRRWLLLRFPLCFRIAVESQARVADVVFTWGTVLVWPRRPYIVEFENPYQITMYRLGWFRLFRPVIRSALLADRCRAIACMSEATRRSIYSEFGQQVGEKAVVTYPVIEDLSLDRPKASVAAPRFLFVATSFRRKGGLEAAMAFNSVAARHPGIQFTMVTNVPDGLRQELEEPGHVRIVKADLGPDVLRRDYFQKADVFIHPSSFDSVPAAMLEAISSGLAVISTKTYAIPEMVEHERNGLILQPALPYFDEAGRAVARYWTDEGLDRAIEKPCLRLVADLEAAIERLLDVELRTRMAAESRRLYVEKFSEAAWQRNFAELLRRAEGTRRS